jgi:hypothetical protein
MSEINGKDECDNYSECNCCDDKKSNLDGNASNKVHDYVNNLIEREAYSIYEHINGSGSL